MLPDLHLSLRICAGDFHFPPFSLSLIVPVDRVLGFEGPRVCYHGFQAWLYLHPQKHRQVRPIDGFFFRLRVPDRSDH